MIVWRGWGILAFLVTIPFAAGMGKFGESTGSDGPLATVLLGLGFIGAGVVNYFLGRYLNVTRPQQQVGRYQDQLRAALWQRVHHGVFQVAPGAPAPTSQEEAVQQIEQVVAQETEGLVRAHSNVHTLFFIPIQWFGLIEAVGGLAVVLINAVKL
ncbi:transcriptional accessory protein [Actinomyces bowdenii]|uniref:transcriptional accessory protein n=1 Tax=Actinomyces bowdenii TaxID=131109 RepID=UPI00214CE834|nr:transcriptional accessory protein [Actinomyces bowdenii]MCR2052706.1 transcriptional accessory protein [Actinomyces bowdenii]